MASYKVCCAAKQKTPNASLPMRANHDQVGAPLHAGVDYALSCISNFDGGISLEACTAKVARDAINQRVGPHSLTFHLRSVADVHFGDCRSDLLQHVQDQDLCGVGPKLLHNSPYQIC
jgi:hypothetical protein